MVEVGSNLENSPKELADDLKRDLKPLDFRLRPRSSRMAIETALTGPVVRKPALDERVYQCLTLDNQLDVLLIHDPVCDKASAAMDVHVGSMQDPRDIPGLAHFLEHMLFMGTEKYPKENDYSEYLAQHGGHSNAFTSATHTNYYFDVGHMHLEGALDRFAQFFIAPLFLLDGVDREMNAVDSEFKKNLQIDGNRFYQIMKTVADPGHPFSQFNVGNLITLKERPTSMGINLLDQLFAFHRQYYSANLMKLVVMGREPLSVLQQWVVDKFSAVKNKNTPVPKHPSNPFQQAQLGREVFVRPVKEWRRLKLIFPVPAVHPHWRFKPLSYLSHLVGHEGQGSILSILKAHAWATGLSAGPSGTSLDFDWFVVSIDLTKEGLVYYREVAEIVFQYIQLIRNDGPYEWIFMESKKLADLGFLFKEKTSPSNYTSSTAGSMQEYPPESYLSGPYTMEAFKPELIQEYVTYLTPANSLWMITTPDVKMHTDLPWVKEEWYGAEYAVRPFEPSLVEHLQMLPPNPKLSLPPHNDLLPENFDVRRFHLDQPAIPRLLRDDGMIRLWFKQDDTFWVPKVNVYVMLQTPVVYETALNAVLTKLYAELVKDHLSEYSYMAECAGLYYGVDVKPEGVMVAFTGFNDRINILIERVLTTLRQFNPEPTRFAVQVEKLTRSFANFEKEAPHQHASFYNTCLLKEIVWTPKEKLNELNKGITVDDLQTFRDVLFWQLHVEMLVHGNMEPSFASSLAQSVGQTIMTPTNGHKPARLLPEALRPPLHRCHILPPASNVTCLYPVPEPTNPNSAIDYYLQTSDGEDVLQRARLGLMAHMMQDPAFNQLRTKEQLGYLVWTTFRRTQGIVGLRMVIQSERDSVYLEQRIESFLIGYLSDLVGMTDEAYAKHVDAVITTLTQRDQNLSQESSRWWNQIDSNFYDFRSVERTVAALKQQSKQEMVDFYKHFIWPLSKHRRKLSIHLRSQAGPQRIQPLTLAQIKTATSRLQQQHGLSVNVPDVVRALGTDLVAEPDIVDTEVANMEPLESNEPVDDAVVQKLLEKLQKVRVSDDGPVIADEQTPPPHQWTGPWIGLMQMPQPTTVLRSESEMKAFKAGLMLGPAPSPIDPSVFQLSLA